MPSSRPDPVRLDVARRLSDPETARLHHLRSINRIAETMEATLDIVAALQRVLEVVLDVFDCDRAWLVDPLDPSAPSYRITYIATRPEWPPFLPPDHVLPMDGPGSFIIAETAAAPGPVAWSPSRPMPNAEMWRTQFGIRSQLMAALRPRGFVPWGLGIHHCRSDREWTPAELELFHDIARRVGDMLGNLLLHRDLRKSEAQLRSLTDAVPQLVYVTTPAGECVECNQRWYSYTGLTEADTLGMGWKRAVHGDEIASTTAAWQEAVSSGEPLEHEFRLRRADGEYRWFLNRAVCVRDQDGTILRWVGTCTDIDDQRQAEAAMRHSEEQLRQAQKMEAVGRLAGGVAHDFNNLLTAINGNAGLLLASMVPEDPLRVHAEDILHAGERAAALTRQLLTFSRKEVVAPRPVHLGHIIGDLQRMLRRLIGEDIDLVTQDAEELWTIRADPGQLEQVILNLTLNARDAMPQGGQLTVATRNVAAAADDALGDCVELLVRDTGKGMDEATRAHLFEPFFTTKEAGRGTGLGLSTVYGIVAQSHGSIAVDSELGRGTEVRVRFPRVEAGATPSPQAAPSEIRRALGHETVLLVEDDDSVRRFAQIVLESLGYQVRTAPSGDAALALAQQWPGQIDLLVTDVVMSGLTGRQLAEQLLVLRPGTKVLYMSGYTEDAILRRGVEGQSAAFLAKPFTAASLGERVREVLDAKLREA